MALDASLIGTRVGPIEAEVDARWTMAYAAGLDDLLPCYLDTRRTEGIIAHPLFPVCFEWPAAGAIRAKTRATMEPSEPARGVHATHHMVFHRALRPPTHVFTTAELIGVEACRPGAYETVRFETVDSNGAPICTTYAGNIYRQVEVKGADLPAPAPAQLKPSSMPRSPRAEMPIRIGGGMAHVYTECARIWNPIHTDEAVAAAAGLPGLILHGTATLALAVSAIVKKEAGGNPERVAEIYARFGAMVMMPSNAVVRIYTREATARGDAIFFEMLNADGGRAVRDGVIMLRD